MWELGMELRLGLGVAYNARFVVSKSRQKGFLLEEETVLMCGYEWRVSSACI